MRRPATELIQQQRRRRPRLWQRLYRIEKPHLFASIFNYLDSQMRFYSLCSLLLFFFFFSFILVRSSVSCHVYLCPAGRRPPRPKRSLYGRYFENFRMPTTSKLVGKCYLLYFGCKHKQPQHKVKENCGIRRADTNQCKGASSVDIEHANTYGIPAMRVCRLQID